MVEDRYPDDETALILRRAAELQGMAPDAVTAPTLADLEQVADEAGIEPRYVRQAAAEVAASRGGQASPRLRRTLAGELPPSAFDALVEEIRAATGMTGHATMTGRGFTWTSASPGQPAPPRAITVTVAAVDGQTVIRADESLAPVASNYLGTGVASALIGGFGMVSATGGNPSVGVIAAAVAWAGGSLLGARYLTGRTAARRRRELAAVLERISGRCEPLIAAPEATGTPGS